MLRVSDKDSVFGSPCILNLSESSLHGIGTAIMPRQCHVTAKPDPRNEKVTAQLRWPPEWCPME